MFWRRKKQESDEEELIELPPLEEVKIWVHQLIVSLKLEQGSFTFLPAYGGVLLFIKNEGIGWMPYAKIQEALGKVDKGNLIESGAVIGSAAAVVTHTVALPAILLPSIIKGSYRIFAKPSPKKPMNFLLSMIEKVVIMEKKVNQVLLSRFEEVPLEKNERSDQLTSYVIRIYRKILDKPEDESVSIKFLKGLTTFISGTDEPIFPIPPQSDIKTFGKILENNNIVVDYIMENEVDEELPEPND